MIEMIGFIAATVMPLWNIPLIVKLQQRKSSQDLSLAWVLGVWVCIFLMLPAALRSPDAIFRLFAVMNAILFTGVVIQTIRFRA